VCVVVEFFSLDLSKKGTLFPFSFFLCGLASSSQDRTYHRAVTYLLLLANVRNTSQLAQRITQRAGSATISRKVTANKTGLVGKNKHDNSFMRKSPPRAADLWYSFIHSLAIVYKCIYTCEPITSPCVHKQRKAVRVSQTSQQK
jgi:hypothetical protein